LELEEKMKIKEVHAEKSLTLNVGDHYIKAIAGMTVEIGEGEEPNWDEIYDELNRQLNIEGDMESRWIKRSDLKDHWKLTIKIPKRGEKHG
jgi:hypothetical protein